MARRTRVSRGTTRYSRTANRKFVWARRNIQSAAVAANTAVFSDLLTDFQSALGADIVGVTVVRIRGAMNFAGPSHLIGGIRVMTQSTFATLPTPGAGPGTDQYADWMAYLPWMHDDTPGEFTKHEIDVQSSRKIDEIGQGLLLSVSNLTLDAAVFNMDLSIGLKLP